MNTFSPPESWRLAKLKDVALILMGQSPSSSTYSIEGIGLPFIGGASDLGNVYPNPRNWTKSDSQVCLSGDIIYTVRATIGKINISDRDYVLGRGVAAIRPDDILLSSSFLNFWLQMIEPYFLRLGSGSTFADIGRDDLENAPVLLPTKPEQERIVAILRQAERARDLQQEIENVSTSLEQALFLEMFGDPIRPHHGWRSKNLSEFVEISAKQVDPRRSEYAELPQIGGENIESLTGRLLDVSTVRESGKISGNYLFNASDILYSKIRPALRKVATPQFAGLCSADIYPITFDTSQCTRKFVAQLLRSNHFTNYVIRASSRAQIPKVNREDLLKYRTAMPSIEAQIAFEQRALIVEQLQNECSTQFKTTGLLVQSLVSRAFTGELTAAWRERNSALLKAVAAERDEYLRAAQAARLKTRRGAAGSIAKRATDSAKLTETATVEVIEAPEPFPTSHRRYPALAALSAAQRDAYIKIIQHGKREPINVWQTKLEWPLARTRELLKVLTALGFVEQVSTQVTPTGNPDEMIALTLYGQATHSLKETKPAANEEAPQ